MIDPHLCANGMFEDAPRRSLAEYAEELRDRIDDMKHMREIDPHLFSVEDYHCLRQRLLAVERQLNWRASI